jgi:hypothetical protein
MVFLGGLTGTGKRKYGQIQYGAFKYQGPYNRGVFCCMMCIIYLSIYILSSGGFATSCFKNIANGVP